MREGNGRGARATPIPHRGSTPHASAIDARLASLPSLTSPPQKITTMKKINPPPQSLTSGYKSNATTATPDEKAGVYVKTKN